MVALKAIDAVHRNRSVTLLAAPGAYGAPLAQLIWGLMAEYQMAVTAAFVVVDDRGRGYLERELLDSGQVLDQLRGAIGDELLRHEEFHLHQIRRESSDPVGEFLDPRSARRFRDGLWRAAREAIARAGAQPVIFSLIPGVPATAAAMMTACFQLLGRPQDALVEVRVADRRIDGEVPFYFPHQNQRFVSRGHCKIDATKVRIDLAKLDLPRFSGVIDGRVVESLDDARTHTSLQPERLPPQLFIDLESGEVRVDEQVLQLSHAERFWYAYLAHHRGNDAGGWVTAGQAGQEDFVEFLQRSNATKWARSIRTKPLRLLIEGEAVPDDDLRNLRGKTVQRVKKWCAQHCPARQHFLVPEMDGKGHQRLPLPSHLIALRGLSAH